MVTSRVASFSSVVGPFSAIDLQTYDISFLALSRYCHHHHHQLSFARLGWKWLMWGGMQVALLPAFPPHDIVSPSYPTLSSIAVSNINLTSALTF